MNPRVLIGSVVFWSLALACGPVTPGADGGTGGGGMATAPTILSSVPMPNALNVGLNANAQVTFSERMNGTTLTPATFTLTSGTPAVAVAGTVLYSNSRATFRPNAALAPNTRYTATVTTGAQSAVGVALATHFVFAFTTGTVALAPLPVNLGTAENFVVLAKTGISTVPASVITGNVGLSPAAATFITGFSLSADATNVFSSSPQVTGQIFAADYAVPTPTNMTTAISDMELAFTDAAGRPAAVTELGAGNIGGMTLTGGVYNWGTGLLIPSNLTLNGSATDVWILQIAQDLTISNGVQISLTGGALAKNVFWQVSGAISVGTTAHAEGVMLSQTAITLSTGASINGRLLAQSAINLDTSTVVQPAP